MTALDCLRDEMIKRGCSVAQTRSKTVAVVLDIVANSGNKYTRAWNDIGDLEQQIKNRLREIDTLDVKIRQMRNQLERMHEEFCGIQSYIESFCEALNECETPTGRDAMKRAQMFVNSVGINSKYDNTAFIIGLAAILSKGECGSLETLKKINPKLFRDDWTVMP